MIDPIEVRAVEHDVARTVHLFYLHLDNQAYESLADLMMPDGVWYRGGKELRGRAMLLEALDGRGTGRRSRHLITNMIVDVTVADRAEAMFYSTAFVHVGESQEGVAPMQLPSSIGAYRGEFARTPQGWRIAALRSKMAFRR